MAETSTMVASPPFGSDQAELHQLLLDALRFGIGLVDLIDGHDDRNAGRFGVVDRLPGLRHDAVVGRNHQDHDIGHLGTTGSHGGKGFMAGGVEEGDFAAVELDVIGADVLRDAASLAGNDVGFANCIQERGLAVVDMSHDSDNRRTLFQAFGCIGHRLLDLFQVNCHVLDLIAVLGGQDGGSVVVQRMVDGYHHAHLHQRLDQVGSLDAHALGQFAHADRLGDLDDTLDGLGNGDLGGLAAGFDPTIPLAFFLAPL